MRSYYTLFDEENELIGFTEKEDNLLLWIEMNEWKTRFLIFVLVYSFIVISVIFTCKSIFVKTNRLGYRIGLFLYTKCANYLGGDNSEVYLYDADGDSFDDDFAEENNSINFFNLFN